jgi:hypothetical protein
MSRDEVGSASSPEWFGAGGVKEKEERPRGRNHAREQARKEHETYIRSSTSSSTSNHSLVNFKPDKLQVRWVCMLYLIVGRSKSFLLFHSLMDV